MARTRIKWNIRAFEELRRSSGMDADLKRRASRIANAAGSGYEAKAGQGRSRDRAAVLTTTYDAIRDNARHNTLLKSLDAGR